MIKAITILREIIYKAEMLRFLRSDISKANFPKIVVLQSLNRCNCSCMMCPYPYTVAKEAMSAMPEELYENILNQLLGQEDFKSLIFAYQNEPLLDDRLIAWARKYKEMLPDKKLELVTNGSLLTPKIAEQVYEFFDYVHISLNALNIETHKTVTNSNHYSAIFQNLRVIAQKQSQRKKTIIRFINQKSNHLEKRPFYKFWRSKGFMVFGFDVNDRLKGVHDFENQIKMPSSKYRKMKMAVLKLVGKLLVPTCPIPFLCFYIKSNGSVVQCFNDWTNENILGNVNERRISEIFSSDDYQIVRDKLLKDKLDENVICSKCDLYREGIWLTV